MRNAKNGKLFQFCGDGEEGIYSHDLSVWGRTVLCNNLGKILLFLFCPARVEEQRNNLHAMEHVPYKYQKETERETLEGTKRDFIKLFSPRCD